MDKGGQVPLPSLMELFLPQTFTSWECFYPFFDCIRWQSPNVLHKRLTPCKLYPPQNSKKCHIYLWKQKLLNIIKSKTVVTLNLKPFTFSTFKKVNTYDKKKLVNSSKLYPLTVYITKLSSQEKCSKSWQKL